MPYRFLYIILISLLVSNCSSVNPLFEEPEVQVDSFSVVSVDSFNPVFEIGLRVINPNKQAINIQGLSYSAVIEGQKILTGVSDESITLAGFNETSLTLNAKADLLNGFQLLSKLINSETTNPNYSLQIKMNVGSFKLPIVITRKGVIGGTN